MGKLAKFIGTEDASALVEFSLTLPLLVVFFMAAISFALVVQQGIAVTDAAGAGARYGANGHGTDITGMQSAATTAAGNISGFVAAASEHCTCTPGGTASSCSGTCFPSPTTPARYVTVTATAPAPLLFSIAGLPKSLPLSATSTMRAPW